MKKDLNFEKQKSSLSYIDITINDFKIKNTFIASKNIEHHLKININSEDYISKT